MTARAALLTSNPRLVEPFLRDVGRNPASCAIDVPLAIWVRPSMGLGARVRELGRTLGRQAGVNRTTPAAQLLHHLVYRWLSRAAGGAPPASAVAVLREGRAVVEVPSGNAPEAVAALRASGCSLCAMVGGDVLSPETLGGGGVPFVNVHLGDPAFVRGQPAVFWEVLDGRSSIVLTLHRVIPAVDAGPIVRQRRSPIVWGPTLGETLRRTRERAAPEIARLLADGIPAVLREEPGPLPSAPGRLRTTPTIRQALEARRVCRERFGGRPG
ncbi:MAG: hypothetical protein AB1578_10865 [Thermodesulfobacteriota bacterium]